MIPRLPHAQLISYNTGNRVPQGQIAYLKKNALGSYFVQWLSNDGLKTHEVWGQDAAMNWAKARFQQVIIHR